MASNTQVFHRFPELPAELRLIVWEMAICTAETPRLHFYSLFHDENSEREKIQLRSMMRLRSSGYDKYSARYPPRLESQTSQLKKGWARVNRVEYFWDDGLRLACWESRLVILPHLKSQKQREDAIDTRKRKPTHCRCVVTMRGRDSHDAQVRIRPRRDIVCLRLSANDLETSDCLSDTWLPKLLECLPFYYLRRNDDLNLAMEFEPGWARGLIGKETETQIKGLYHGLQVARMIKPSFDDAMTACLTEPTKRGLAIRAFMAWKQGLLPQNARMYLIDCSGGLPSSDKIHITASDGGGDSSRYQSGLDSYPRQLRDRDVSLKSGYNGYHVFTDGRQPYVESYTWDVKSVLHDCDYNIRYESIPVLDFIWIMRYCYGHNDVEGGPDYRYQHFFRVLRQLPGNESDAEEIRNRARELERLKKRRRRS